MPKMDGITFLKKLMIQVLTPTIIVSSYAHAGAELTLDALAAGAVDVVTKPSDASSGDLGKKTYQSFIREN